MRAADPHGRIAMILKRIAGIRMHEDVQRAVIEREPFEHRRQLLARKAELIRPHRMRADRPFMKSPERELAALKIVDEVRFDDLPQLPRGITRCFVEVDMRVPACNRGLHRFILARQCRENGHSSEMPTSAMLRRGTAIRERVVPGVSFERPDHGVIAQDALRRIHADIRRKLREDERIGAAREAADDMRRVHRVA